MAVEAQGMHLQQRTTLLPSAVQLQFLSLLPLPQRELGDLLEAAIRDNPLLQRAPGAPCAVCGRHCRSGLCGECRTLRLPVESRAHVDWRATLLADLRAALPVHLHRDAEMVVASLDDHGFLPEDDGTGEAAETGPVLAALREVGPPGIGAHSASECLRLQVAALVDDGSAPAFLLDVLDHHLEAVAAGDLAAVATALDIPLRVVAEAVDCLRTRTRPFVLLDAPGPRTPAPDVLFRREEYDDALHVEVTDLTWFGVELDDEIWSSAGPEGRAWLRPYRREATDLLRSVRARSVMLLRVATVLAERQRGFLLEGPAAHRPLTRHEVAAAIGVHPATVGRAVEGKDARCPDGRLVPLSACFGGRTAVLEALRELVASHPAATDAELSDLLTARGLRVARRTVSKYRALLRPARR